MSRRAIMFERAVRCLLPCIAAVAMQASHAEPYAFPPYAKSEQVDADCDRMLADLKASEARLEEMASTRGVALLVDLDAMQRRYEDAGGPMALLTAVHPDKSIRDATDACDLKYQAFNSAFLQNARIYALLKQVQPADDIDRRYQRDLLDAFEDSGVGLPDDKRSRAQQINNDITRLTQEFERRVREDKTRVPFTVAELQGVPADLYKDAQRDEQGRYLLGLGYPTSFPFLENAANGAARERMWRAFQNTGGVDNLKTLAQLGEMRHEYARLFGFESYSDFALRRRMARSEGEVQKFLGTVKDAVAKREVADLEVLRQSKALHLKQSLAKTVVKRWDVLYYTQRARKARFALDQEQFRQYFPPEASLQFVFRLATQLFGVKFTPVQRSLWHADARAFELADIATGQPLGTLFVDLYPRDDKYNHAACWSFRNVSTLVGRQPAAGLVVNFNRQGLTIDELETLLHEFGHALHALLSTTRYTGEGGTNVKLDFVEAPSQMLEDWVYDRKVLALFKDVCPTCKPVPAALLARADKARHFAKGILFSRQHLYASYDLAFYGKQSQEPMALWTKMEGATPLGHVPDTMFPAGFAHIAGGYAAGYYAYLWSLVVAEDLRTAFAANKLDASVGRRYRATVLSHGGEVDPNELVAQFLGRPTDSRAFFKSLSK